MHGVRRVTRTKEALEEKRRKEKLQIQKYRKLESTVLDERDAKIYNAAAFKRTTELLDLNPEFYTVWNYRRAILSHGLFSEATDNEKSMLLDQELDFLTKKMKSWPKSYWIWNHRRWCLETHPQANWRRELGLVNMLLDMDERNFFGWHYRRYIVSKIESVENTELAKEEFEYTTEKINKNFSNFSAWHNRSKLIPRLLESQESSHNFQDPAKFLETELEYVKQAIFMDPEDQSAWIYHRWLLFSDDIVAKIENATHISILQHELQAVQELYEMEEASRWCIDSIVYYTQQLRRLQKQEMSSEERQTLHSLLDRLIELDPTRKQRYAAWKSQL